jgi:UDP-glucuronate decarboxylase
VTPPLNETSPASESEIESLARRIDFSPLRGLVVAITGSQGMMGNYLCQVIMASSRLQGNSPKRLISIGRRELQPTQAWAMNFKNFEHQIIPSTLDAKFPASDFFLHLASPASPNKYDDSANILSANLGGAIAALSNQNSNARFLFLSSGEVYGSGSSSGSRPKPEANLKSVGGRSAYPNAKLSTEFLLDGWSSATKGDARIARLFHTFGPGFTPDDGRSFADIIWAASRGEDISLYSDGASVRPFAYIEDSIAGVLILLLAEGNSLKSDVGGDFMLSIRQFADMTASATGVKVQVMDHKKKGERHEALGDPPTPDTSLLRSLGWSAEVPISEGIQRTIIRIKNSA